MSIKKEIYDILKNLNLPNLSYGFSSNNTFPKIIFFHVATYNRRLSNEKAIKHHVYQINVYDYVAHDLETSNILSSIESAFETSKFNTTDWQEVINVNTDNKAEFMYFMEVHI